MKKNLNNSKRVCWFYRACVVLSLIGLSRTIYIHVFVDRKQTDGQKISTSIDLRYESIKKLIPPEIKEVGYLSEQEEILPFNDKYYLQANYALAPRIVVPMNDRSLYVLVDFEQPISFEDLQSKYNLSLLSSTRPNFGLLRKVSK